MTQRARMPGRLMAGAPPGILSIEEAAGVGPVGERVGAAARASAP